MSFSKNTIIIILILFFIGFLLVFFGVLPGLKPVSPERVTLVFWGIKDEEGVWRDIIKAFQEANPHVTITYSRLDEAGYEETLINRLAEGRGPDIFMLSNYAFLKHRDKIAPLPQQAFKFSARDFKRVFADQLSPELIEEDGTIIGMPLFLDSLALFYNKDFLNSSGIANPPENWEEVVETSKKIVKKSTTGELNRGGIALGSFDNVEHALEIVSSLIIQKGDPIIDRKSQAPVLGKDAIEALAFYTSFADKISSHFSWTSGMPNSLDSFAEGTSTMMIGFSSDIPRIQARNPHLNFGVAELPQLQNAQIPVTLGRHFFPTVSKLSKNQITAWQFILFATSENQVKDYLSKTKKPPARRDLIAKGAPNAELEIFYRQSLISKSWPMPDYLAVRKLFKDAIESIMSRAQTPQQAAGKLRDQLKLLIP